MITLLWHHLTATLLQVETRKRMQREYERKMASIRDATAQKQADEAKRQQQRKAAISRLQTATEVGVYYLLCICHLASTGFRLSCLTSHTSQTALAWHRTWK